MRSLFYRIKLRRVRDKLFPVEGFGCGSSGGGGGGGGGDSGRATTHQPECWGGITRKKNAPAVNRIRKNLIFGCASVSNAAFRHQ